MEKYPSFLKIIEDLYLNYKQTYKNYIYDGSEMTIGKIINHYYPEIPVIASGGVGEINHLIEGVTIGGADAVLAASIFHFDIISIEQVKRAFRECGINVRDSN